MKNRITILTYFSLLLAVSITSCKKEETELGCTSSFGSVTDIDGNSYRTIVVDSMEWMIENLRTTRYNNGDTILNVTEAQDWQALNTGAWCSFENNVDLEAIYGKLYNWYAVSDARNIAPTGWHVATDEEWQAFELHFGMDPAEVDSLGFLYRGLDDNVGGKMKSSDTEEWISPNEGATNESCFSALPGGSRFQNGTFSNVGYYGTFWTSTMRGSNKAWYRSLTTQNGTVARSYYGFRYGVSVRCVRDRD